MIYLNTSYDGYTDRMSFTFVLSVYFIGVKAMCNCLECKENFDSKSKLSRHIFLIHKLTSKEYYDKFLNNLVKDFVYIVVNQQNLKI